jgi:hypothetical protein
MYEGNERRSPVASFLVLGVLHIAEVYTAFIGFVSLFYGFRQRRIRVVIGLTSER